MAGGTKKSPSFDSLEIPYFWTFVILLWVVRPATSSIEGCRSRPDVASPQTSWRCCLELEDRERRIISTRNILGEVTSWRTSLQSCKALGEWVALPCHGHFGQRCPPPSFRLAKPWSASPLSQDPTPWHAPSRRRISPRNLPVPMWVSIAHSDLFYFFFLMNIHP